MMLVYDDVITRITVFCILFLLDDAQHQRNQTDRPINISNDTSNLLASHN